jgi:uncharacterized membrane protein (DUF485 family)
MANQDKNAAICEEIRCNPRYQELVVRRNSFQLWTTILTLVGLYFFICLAAFYPAFLAQPMSQGSVTTIGVVLGIGLMVIFYVLTGIYIYRANSYFDVLNDNVLLDYRKEVK